MHLRLRRGKPATGEGAGLSSDAPSNVRSSSSEFSSGNLGCSLASMRRACRARQTFARGAILCFYANKSRFHSPLPLTVIVLVVVVGGGGREGEAC